MDKGYGTISYQVSGAVYRHKLLDKTIKLEHARAKRFSKCAALEWTRRLDQENQRSNQPTMNYAIRDDELPCDNQEAPYVV